MDSNLPSKNSSFHRYWSQGYLEQQELAITRGASTTLNVGNSSPQTVQDVTSHFVIYSLLLHY